MRICEKKPLLRQTCDVKRIKENNGELKIALNDILLALAAHSASFTSTKVFRVLSKLQ
jgi:hypothetical protein